MKDMALLILLILVFPSHASGQAYDSSMVFDRGWVGGTEGGIPFQWFPSIGSPLWIIGTVNIFKAPFTDLLPPSGTYEATYVIEGMSYSWGCYWDAPDGNGGVSAYYTGGTLKIYVDPTPDANPADPSSYRDGELVLEASLKDREFSITESMISYLCPYGGPTQEGYFVFTGGSWIPHVSDGSGRGFGAGNVGCFSTYLPAGYTEMGYVASSRSWIDVYPTVAVHPATWGQIKEMYR